MNELNLKLQAYTYTIVVGTLLLPDPRLDGAELGLPFDVPILLVTFPFSNGLCTNMMYSR